MLFTCSAVLVICLCSIYSNVLQGLTEEAGNLVCRMRTGMGICGTMAMIFFLTLMTGTSWVGSQTPMLSSTTKATMMPGRAMGASLFIPGE